MHFNFYYDILHFENEQFTKKEDQQAYYCDDNCQKQYSQVVDELVVTFTQWKAFLYIQVVGHTPVEKICQEGGVISCDTFSTYRDGTPYGDRTFLLIDTETMEWKAVESSTSSSR